MLLAGLSAGVAAEAAPSQDPAAPPAVTYSKHVAPILWKHCAGCHRQGEIGPFPLLAYADAQKRADFLAEITASRRMPPWKAEPGIGHFRDERRLSEAEIALVGKWAAAGAPEGDSKDLPRPPQFTDGWQLGEPDMIVKMATPFSVPASGRDLYRCFVIPIPLEQDAMVSAVEFRPGNRRVVHHAILFLDATGQARALDGKDGQPGFASFGGPGVVPTGGLGAWAPGVMPRRLPDGIVKYVKRRSDLVLQIHYHPTGKPEEDQSVVGLYFSKKPVTRIVSGIAIVQPELKIPPGRRYHSVRAESQPLPVDVHVLGVSPHMHNLGREIKVVAVDPTGKKSAPLIWIKDWDFNWQGTYQFVRPIRLPKGSKIKVQAHYDNSAYNSKNPNHPPKEVKWGEQTSDEMCLVSVQVFTNTLEDLRQIATMPAYALAAGIEGGVPGVADPAGAPVQVASNAAPAAAGAAGGEPAPAANETAKKEESARPAVAFPEGGVPIPENIRPLFARFDLDNNGLFSRDEVEKMPDALRARIYQDLAKQPADKKQ
jgi:mono/diheme cytochrome c family protein